MSLATYARIFDDQERVRLAAEQIFDIDSGGYNRAVRDMAVDLWNVAGIGPWTERGQLEKVSALEFFANYLHAHVLDDFQLKDRRKLNAWTLLSALLGEADKAKKAGA